MKKNLLLLLSTFMIFSAFAQNAPIDFEAGGNGADWTWTVFENDANPALEIVTNPDQTGANTSATVAKFTALQTGQPFAGTESMHGADIGLFSIDATNSTIRIMVWKTVISDVGIKFANAAGGAFPEIKVPNTLTNQWEELTFDVSSLIGNSEQPFDQIIIFPDFNARAADNIVYFDNITFGEQVVVEEPVTAAPDPTNDPSDVISMFSGVYTDVTVDTWRTDWSQGNLEDVQIVGNDTKKYTGLNFVGIETVGDNLIDATAMTHFHVDMWTPNITSFRVKLVDIGADAAFGGGDDTEHEITFANPAQGQWVSLDIPLTDFTGLLASDHIAQLIFAGEPVGGGTVYIDNVYFYEGTVATEPMTAAPDPTNDPSNVISMFSGVYTDVAINTWRTDWSQGDLEDVQIAGNDTKKYTSLNFVGIESIGENLIDATAMTHFHVDMWTANLTTFKVKLVDIGADADFGGGDDTEHEIIFMNPAQGQWVSLDIPLTDFTGLLATDHIAQLIFAGEPVGEGTVYIDNVYFYNGVVATEPLTAAPDPTNDPSNVISMFSGVYTDVTVDTWRTDWSQGDLEDLQIAGNDTKKYTSLNFIGIETVGDNLLDATAMTHFHIDVWTPNMTTFRVKLVDIGADVAFGGGDDTEHEIIFENPAQGQWISYDLPLTDFTSLLATDHIAQLILSGFPAGEGTVYVDNVYFFNDATGVTSFQENNIKLYPNPVQSSFTIRANENIETVKVYDILGALVMNEKVANNTANFDIAHLATGTYVVVAIVEGKTMVERLIKN